MAQRIGFYGGGFDPIHIGHLILAQTAIESLDLNRVILMPTGGSPYYKEQEKRASGSDRLAMARLAAASHPKIEVSSYEVDSERFCYTIDTLRHLKSESPPGSEIILLVGGDWKDKLPYWKDGDRIVEEFTTAIFSRPGFLRELSPEKSEEESGRILYLSMPLIDISSSTIRERVKKGLSIQFFVPDPVREYIERHGCYL